MRPSLVTTISGVMLLIPASMGLVMGVRPTVFVPFPALTALPALFLSSRIAMVFVPPLIFLTWNPGLFRGEAKPPKRSYVLLAATAVLSVIWFVVGWKDGLHYQGPGYVYKIFAINIAWIASLSAGFFWYSKRKSSFSLNLALNWLLFAWLAWYAFPYLGELP